MGQERKPFAIARERMRGLSWKNFFGLRTIGFALARSWVYLMFLGAAVSFVTWDGQPVPGIIFNGSTIALCATLFTSAFLGERLETLMKGWAWRLSGPALTAVGTLLVASMTLPDAPQALLGALGALCTGVGSGLIDLGYGEVYRNVDPQKTAFEAPFAFFLTLDRVFAGHVLAVGSGMHSGIMFAPRIGLHLVRALESVVAASCRSRATGGHSPGKVLVEDRRVRLPDRVGRRRGARSVHRSERGARGALLPLSSCLGQHSHHGHHLRLRAVLSRDRIAAGVQVGDAGHGRVLHAITRVHRAVDVESSIALAGYGTFNVLIWVLLADISFNFRFSSITVFGIGWGMITLGVLLGSMAGQAICLLAPFAPQTLSLVALLATLAILVSYMFVFRESDLIALTKPDDAQGDAQNDAQEGEPRKRRFHDRCQDVAVEYRLSPKETEIMILFAKGRSSARIQEELYLSRGTVTTHLRHIYQKMDVHSKQEFLDVIEGRRG